MRRRRSVLAPLALACGAATGLARWRDQLRPLQLPAVFAPPPRRGALAAAVAGLAPAIGWPESPAASAEAGSLAVTRPREGKPLYTLSLPKDAGWKAVVLNFEETDDGESTQPDDGALYKSSKGALVRCLQTPVPDFVQKQREKTPPERQKKLKFVLDELQDDLETKFKAYKNNGQMVLQHKWYRVLRDKSGERSAMCEIEMLEEDFKADGPMMEKILDSFKLAPP